MKLDNTQFSELIQQIPVIDVEFEWEGDRGLARVDGFEMECGPFLVFACFTVIESGVTDRWDYFTPPSFSSYGKHVYDVDIEVFDEDTAEEIELTSEQKCALIKAIERSLS